MRPEVPLPNENEILSRQLPQQINFAPRSELLCYSWNHPRGRQTLNLQNLPRVQTEDEDHEQTNVPDWQKQLGIASAGKQFGNQKVSLQTRNA